MYAIEISIDKSKKHGEHYQIQQIRDPDERGTAGEGPSST